MKRIVLIMVVLALCMTQCKKTKNEAAACHDNIVSIRLDASGGAKTNVDPATGEVAFVDGDEVIVANNGVYVGRLTYDGGLFVGTITNPNSDDYLHFYHLGNAELPTLVAGSSEGCVVDISDQINGLPVISYEHSSERYSSAITTYEAKLKNKCSLVRFEVTTPSDFAATCITGMKNTVSVDFSAASFDYGMINDGKIVLPSGAGSRLAILLPQSEVSKGEDGSAFSGRYRGSRGHVPEISGGEYLTNGIEVVMNTAVQPEGALSGLFTVNSSGKQVAFSKGNLSYVKAGGKWRFLDHQYQVIEQDGGYIGINCSRLEVVTLFEWGQSGYNHGAVSYLPYHTDSEQFDFYVYGDMSNNLYDCTGKADWGYNIISNGGSANKQWRTLKTEEWEYLFNSRPGASTKYARAVVDGMKGLAFLPDDWDLPAGGHFTGGSEAAFEDNTYTVGEWQDMENAGAVFFPYAGYRFNNNSYGTNKYGKMWSSSAKTKYDAYGITYKVKVTLDPKDVHQRNSGVSVRLVCE